MPGAECCCVCPDPDPGASEPPFGAYCTHGSCALSPRLKVPLTAASLGCASRGSALREGRDWTRAHMWPWTFPCWWEVLPELCSAEEGWTESVQCVRSPVGLTHVCRAPLRQQRQNGAAEVFASQSSQCHTELLNGRWISSDVELCWTGDGNGMECGIQELDNARRLMRSIFLQEVINSCDIFSPLSQDAPCASVPLPVFRWGNHQ